MLDQEIPRDLYTISTHSRNNLLSIPDYLYPLWALLLMQLTVEGDMDSEMTNLFDRELRVSVSKLAAMKDELRSKALPF